MSDDDIYCRKCHDTHDAQYCPSEAKDDELIRLRAKVERMEKVVEAARISDQYRGKAAKENHACGPAWCEICEA